MNGRIARIAIAFPRRQHTADCNQQIANFVIRQAVLKETCPKTTKSEINHNEEGSDNEPG